MGLFPFPPIENDWKWLYQLLPINYELKLPSEAMPTSFAIQNQIEAVCIDFLDFFSPSTPTVEDDNSFSLPKKRSIFSSRFQYSERTIHSTERNFTSAESS